MGEDEDIARSVREHGWHGIAIGRGEDGEPSFTYTIGLTSQHGHPELVVFGLDDRAYALLAGCCKAVAAGGSFETDGVLQATMNEQPVAFRPVHPSQHELNFGYAMAHCRLYGGGPGTLRVLQVLWPDASGLFPHQLGCAPAVSARQPSLHLAVPRSELQAFNEEYGPFDA